MTNVQNNLKMPNVCLMPNLIFQKRSLYNSHFYIPNPLKHYKMINVEKHFKIPNVDNNIKMPLSSIHFKLPKCTNFILKIH
jgi:hypothetical protein